MNSHEKIKYLIFSLVPLLVFLLVLELGLRGYYYIKLGGYRYRIDRLADLKYSGPYYEENSQIANDLGFSGKGRFDPLKLKNEYRILVLGGSGAAGTRECNWPDVMAEELNKKNLDKYIRVINGGIGGHTSSEEKAWLTRWIKLDPDLIIVYDGWNDMYYSHYLPEEYREQFEISNTYYYLSPVERFERFFAEHSMLFRKIKIFSKKIKSASKKMGSQGGLKKTMPTMLNTSINEKEFEYVPGQPFQVKFNWRGGAKIKIIDHGNPTQDNLSGIYKTNISGIIALAAKHHIGVMLVTQPDFLYHFTNNPQAFAAEEKSMPPAVIKHEGLRQDWINTVAVLYPKIYEAQRGAAMKNKNVIGCYRIDDIFDKFPKKLNLWMDDSCHQTNEGRIIIGKHMADLVYAGIFLPKQKR